MSAHDRKRSSAGSWRGADRAAGGNPPLESDVMESYTWGDAWYARTREHPARELVDLFCRAADARSRRLGYCRREGTSRAPTLGDWAQEQVRTLFSEIERREPGAHL